MSFVRRLAAATPDALFEGPYLSDRTADARAQYDVHPRDGRFVVVRPDEAEVVVVLNWLTDVRERVEAARGRSR